MRVAVTGGSGFIGSHVVDKLAENREEVLVLDVGAPHRADVDHLAVDVLDLEAMTTALRDVDLVFHLAAAADVNVVNTDPSRAVELNVLGTSRVWEAARRCGVPRAVLASTVWVYGAAQAAEPLTEESPFDPRRVNHVYTASKLASEMIVHAHHSLYGQEFTILRYGVPYGERMRRELVIPRFVEQALQGLPITIHGDGSQHRNYVYVGDLADAHVLALGKAATNGVFNLEGREPVSLQRLVQTLSALLERPLQLAFEAGRTGDFRATQVSSASAKEVLGWSPSTSFDDGLRRYVNWHLEHYVRRAGVSTSDRRDNAGG
jgi:UDP-glucose 4-epimerase